jgi:hypothetical protein
MRGALVVLCLLPLGAAAQPWPHAYEGAWIWDKARFIPPSDVPALGGIQSETMLVIHDDGKHFLGRTDRRWDNGGREQFTTDQDEDGSWHPFAPGSQSSLAMSVLPDGGRLNVTNTPGGERYETRCHLTDGGDTLMCQGTHVAVSGSRAGFECIYHRDRHMVPVS